ncbi:hypothetical protein ACH0C8_16355, partial [Acetobacter lovaniensis]|uniref:hypothetical protein n=1 Tax=Acetobacter lovaniensis TaxID=104100 RepID=UPI00377042DC
MRAGDSVKQAVSLFLRKTNSLRYLLEMTTNQKKWAIGAGVIIVIAVVVAAFEFVRRTPVVLAALL